MSRYIDVEKAEAAITSVMPTTNTVGESYYRGLYNARAIISVMPDSDVEPVRHAHWIRQEDADGTFYLCSGCGEYRFYQAVPKLRREDG